MGRQSDHKPWEEGLAQHYNDGKAEAFGFHLSELAPAAGSSMMIGRTGVRAIVDSRRPGRSVIAAALALTAAALLTACSSPSVASNSAPNPDNIAGNALQRADDHYRYEFERLVALNASPEETPCGDGCWNIKRLEGDEDAIISKAYRVATDSYHGSQAPEALTSWQTVMKGVVTDVRIWADSANPTGGHTTHSAAAEKKTLADIDRADAIVNTAAAPDVRANPTDDTRKAAAAIQDANRKIDSYVAQALELRAAGNTMALTDLLSDNGGRKNLQVDVERAQNAMAGSDFGAPNINAAKDWWDLTDFDPAVRSLLNVDLDQLAPDAGVPFSTVRTRLMQLEATLGALADKTAQGL